jgi:hypothetical protein
MTAATAELDTPPTVATPPLPEVPRIPNWMKILVDSQCLAFMREMLSIGLDDELPRELWIAMGIRRALERNHVNKDWGPSEYASIIIEASHLACHKQGHEIIPGSEVTLKKENRRGIYVHFGPLGRLLVNVGGIFRLVPMKDVTVHRRDLTELGQIRLLPTEPADSTTPATPGGSIEGFVPDFSGLTSKLAAK